MWSNVPVQLCSGEREAGKDNIEMIVSFAKYMQRSKNLKKYTILVADEELIFDVGQAVEQLADNKRLDRQNLILMENVTRCFETVRIIGVVYSRLEQMRNEAFDQFNENHVSMLENLWRLLKNTPRSTEGIVSSDWLQLGFQGSDPTTDFRSMGILGLFQLQYFAKRKTDCAKLILSELSQPAKSFPFAIIGINLTSLIMEMFTQLRLHRYIIEKFGNLTVDCSLAYLEGPSKDNDCIRFCCELVHDIYCMAFEEFYLVWVIRKPSSIMAFSDLFKEVKDTMHEKYKPLSS